MSTADLSKLTAIISTSDRPKSLKRLVRSLHRGYPELRVLVADASSEPSRPLCDTETIQLPAGTSRSEGFNALLARVRTPYFLLLDEQCELPKETQIEPLLRLLAQDELDIAAGDLIECRKSLWFFIKRVARPEHGLMEFAGDSLTLSRGCRTAGEGFNWCDLVGPFFVARTNKVRTLGGWDQELIRDEQVEFFVRAHRRGLRVGLVPEVTSWKWNEPAAANQSAQPDMKSLAVAKMGLSRLTDLDGGIYKAPRRAQAA